jgi:hypothetical protein
MNPRARGHPPVGVGRIVGSVNALFRDRSDLWSMPLSSWRRRLGAPGLAVCVMLTCTACPWEEAAPVVKSAVKAVDEGAASRVGSKVRVASEQWSSAKASFPLRLRAIGENLTADEDVNQAVIGLIWATGCSLATGDIHREVNDVQSYLETHAVAFGLALNGSAGELASKIFDAYTSSPSAAQQQCERIPDALKKL